jgi:toxin ParE1/3/4
MAYRLAPEAEADLQDIAFYVFHETGNIEAADRVLQLVAQRFDLLADHPRAGRARDDLRPGIRVFPVGSYLLLYREAGPDVVIVRVLHGSRDIEALFDDE